ncbi:AAA family ATPase, partial [Actinomadura fibrosa]
MTAEGVPHGRRRELGAIAAMLDSALAGRGGAMAVLADAGMGKTALLDAAVRSAAARADGPGFQVLGTTGVPRETSVPYSGLHRLLRPLAALVPDLRPVHRKALAPITGGASGGGADPFDLYAAVYELLTAAARNGPVLCWADDAQWIDPLSLDALGFAARRVQDEPVAMLFAARDDRPAADALTGLPRLPLAPLTEEAGRQVLRDALAGSLGGVLDGVLDSTFSGTLGGTFTTAVALGGAAGEPLDADLAEEVVALACGCPLAIRELAAALTPAQLSGTAPPPRSLPAGSTLRAHYRRRHLALPAGARRLVLITAADELLHVSTFGRAARTAGVPAWEVEAVRGSGLLRFEGDVVTVRDRLVRSSLWAEASRLERQAAHTLLAAVLDQSWQRPWRLWHRAALTGEPDDRTARELADTARTSQAAGRYAESWRIWRRAAALTPDRGTRTDHLLAAAGDAWASGRARQA